MKIFIERPFVFVSLAYAVGIVLGTLSQFLVPWLVFACAALVSLVVLIWLRSPKIFLTFAFIFLAAVGALSFRLSQFAPAQDVSNPAFHGRGSLQGRVISEVDQKQKGKKEIISFTLRAGSWWKGNDKAQVSGKVRVTLLNAGLVPSYGDEVRLRGTLAPPKSAMNPGEFDYRSYLEKQNIRASFLGFGKKAIKTLDSRFRGNDKQPWIMLLRKIFDLRRAIHHRVYQLARAPERDILLSLVTGERTNIPREITDDFIRTGTVHVLAISGFQVSLVAGFTFFLFRWLGLSMKMAALAASSVLILYVPLAGWQLPVQRAGIMGLVVMGAIMLSRESDVISSLFLAFFVLLVMNPNHLYSVAFQLSFISVLAMIGLAPKFSEWLNADFGNKEALQKDRWWGKGVRSMKILVGGTLAAILGTWPLVLYYFHGVSFTSLLANLVIVPLTTLALFSLILVLSVSMLSMTAAGILMEIPGLAVQFSLTAAHLLARFPLGYLHVAKPHWIFLVLYYSFFLVFALGIYRSWNARKKWAFALCGMTVSLFLFLPLFKASEELVILNVPRSSVLFAEDREGHAILVNGGRGEPSSHDEWTIIPFLKSRGIRNLDAVFVTSTKKKYWGGLFKIMDHCRVNSLLVPWPHPRDESFRALLRKSRHAKSQTSGLLPGDRFLFSESLSVEILDLSDEKKERSRYWKEGEDPMLRITHNDLKLLFIGEGNSARDLIRVTEEETQPADILYLSSVELLNAEWVEALCRVCPRLIILANGPKEVDSSVKNRLASQDIVLLDLRSSGALSVHSEKGRFEVEPFVRQ